MNMLTLKRGWLLQDIPATGAIGAWIGQAGKIAAWRDGAWVFATPQEGRLAWIKDEDILLGYNGAAWQAVSSGGVTAIAVANSPSGNITATNVQAAINELDAEKLNLAGGQIAQIGINASPDGTNKLSINSASSLFNHNGNGHQIKINKNGVADTASILYQTSFSGRAEFGTTGDDDFHIKVSPNGSTWVEALVINKTTGRTKLVNSEYGLDRFYAFTDCCGVTATAEWLFNAIGAGATHSAADFPVANSVGAVSGSLGTVATNSISIAAQNVTTFQLGQGVTTFKTRLQLQSLSNATDTWSFRTGFINTTTSESSNGVFFRYTHSVNGGKFQAVTRSNSVETAVDTGITVAINTTYKFEIEVNAAGTSATFMINGAVVATITTNIPTANGQEVGYGLLALRSAGTTAINTYLVDYILCDLIFTTPR